MALVFAFLLDKFIVDFVYGFFVNQLVFLGFVGLFDDDEVRVVQDVYEHAAKTQVIGYSKVFECEIYAGVAEYRDRVCDMRIDVKDYDEGLQHHIAAEEIIGLFLDQVHQLDKLRDVAEEPDDDDEPAGHADVIEVPEDLLALGLHLLVIEAVSPAVNVVFGLAVVVQELHLPGGVIVYIEEGEPHLCDQDLVAPLILLVLQLVPVVVEHCQQVRKEYQRVQRKLHLEVVAQNFQAVLATLVLDDLALGAVGNALFHHVFLLLRRITHSDKMVIRKTNTHGLRLCAVHSNPTKFARSA